MTGAPSPGSPPPGRDARPGTFVTLSGGRFLYHRRLKPAPRPRLPAPTVEPRGVIATASVDDLIGSSPEDVLHDIQLRVHRFPWFQLYVGVAVAGLLFLTSQDQGAVLATVATVAVGLGVAVFRWDRERRTVRLHYDTDNPELVQRSTLCAQAGQALASAAGLWHIFYSVPTDDQKRNAGATHLIKRTRVACVPRPLPHIVCNLQPFSIPAGPQQLLFLPDRLLVHQEGRFAAVPYGDLSIDAEPAKYIETDTLPRDAQVVGKTWRFVRRDGGPDRRFNDNRELPIALYGELHLRSKSGVQLIFQASRPGAAEEAQAALATLRRLSAPSGRAALSASRVA